MLLDAMSPNELYSVMPELREVSVRPDLSLEHVLDQVRDALAITYHRVPDSNKYMHDLQGGDGRPKTGKTRLAKSKDYSRNEVVQFESSRARYWLAVKEEVHSLVCTKSTKYSDVRKKLEQVGQGGSSAVVSLVAAAIGNTIGVAAGAITGLVAVLLLVVLKLGVAAYCSMIERRGHGSPSEA